MEEKKYLLLAGGVGAAKFIKGLASIVNPEILNIVVNTGDDIELFGLTICPDLDIITYTLAGIIDKEKGWGFNEETFNSLSVLNKYYDIGWFNAGDKDLATHIFRTDLFKQGFSKYEITKIICNKLGVKSNIIPMCNEPFETYIKTPLKKMHFEEYFIKERCEPEVLGIEFKGIENVKPIDIVFDYIEQSEKIIICPSNPIVSIGTILTIPGIREALSKVKEKVYAISPIIEGSPIKGPADKLMRGLDLEVSCTGVAKYYQDIIGHFIIDNKDSMLKSEIESLGIKSYCFDTIMKNQQKKEELARFILNIDNV